MFDLPDHLIRRESVDEILSKSRRWKVRGRRRNRHREKHSSEADTLPLIKDFVSEDLFLMESRKDRLDINLLSNSLAARLKQNVPDCHIKQATLNKLRRDSLRDYVHLNNLNKQYTSEMNWESNRLDNESFQLIKRHQHLKKNSLQQRQSQEKIESQLQNQRSGRSSAGSTLPILADSRADSVFPSPRQQTSTLDEDFPEFASIDKEDTSTVKVFKLRGIFQPQNKYSSKHELDIIPKPAHGSESEGALLRHRETPADIPSKSRSRKGLRVTWSSQSQYFANRSNDSEEGTLTPSREESIPTPSTIKTNKSDFSTASKKLAFSNGRSKIETIGLKWKLPAGSVQQKPAKQSFPGVSRNLMPVTTAMNKVGTSTSKTRWQVHRVPHSVPKYHVYQAWLEKLEVLKGGSKTPSIPAIKVQSRMSNVTAQPVK